MIVVTGEVDCELRLIILLTLRLDAEHLNVGVFERLCLDVKILTSITLPLSIFERSFGDRQVVQLLWLALVGHSCK